MITEEELETLVEHIHALETENEDLRVQVDFLLRERILLKEGAKSLRQMVTEMTAPPGVAFGRSGLLFISDPNRISDPD